MPPSPRRRILIVEDDADTRAAYRGLLEHAGWSVEEATRGEEALRLAAGGPPDLALIDISIPGVDGWETTRRLKADAATRRIPIIAITGHALEEDRQRAQEVGCDVYLVKPLDPQRLLAEVRRIGEREEASRAGGDG